MAGGVATVGFIAVGPVGSFLGLALTPILLRSATRRRAAGRRESLEGELRDAVIAMAAGLRAGLSTRLAVAEAARDAEPSMSAALDGVLHRLDLGEPLDVALEHLLGALQLPDATLLVNVLRIHRRTGGDLPALLDRVAYVIGGRTAERRQLRVMTAQAKASGVVLAALPVAFVALLSGAGGDGLGAFYRSPLGVTLLLFGIVLDAAGFAWMRRIVRGVEDVR
ncbi:MAG: type II secretion system F family protein [Actinomycetota bacterium]|nr:type II secretion system F family protein [Actinomycetota bacterium]